MSGNVVVLVTGATGYVGGRLVPRLLDAGYRVRCLVRDRARLEGRSWQNRVEIIEGDAMDLGSLDAAFQGVQTAYYLIHGMEGGKPNAEQDLQMARNFRLQPKDRVLDALSTLARRTSSASCRSRN